MTGPHSRFDGGVHDWEWWVCQDAPLPSGGGTLGLGRSWAWNQFARVEGMLDQQGRVLRGAADRARMQARAALMRSAGNALDVRMTGGPYRVIPIMAEESGEALPALFAL